MYKKIILLVLLTGILLLLSACTSVEVGNKLNQQKITIGEETPIAHIYMQTALDTTFLTAFLSLQEILKIQIAFACSSTQ